jgi:metal-responsive CopG/Arc/MetJ family transcriptional regulator
MLMYYIVHTMKDANDSILTLRVPKSLIEAIDRAAQKAERERSDWIRRTLKKAVEGK